MSRNTFTSAASAAAVAATDVDPTIWRACAGASVHIPTVGSRVYYFPQGHFEQCISSSSSSPSFSPTSPPSSSSLSSLNLIPPPFFLCRVLSVRFLAHPFTDEPFACLHLLPIPFPSAANADGRVSTTTNNNSDDDDVVRTSNIEDGGEDDVVSFAKILTPSDANNGGGFSVPRFCADAILPPLNFEAEPPVQNLMIRDVHGNAWEFRHIYRGTPRRHLLTTGWSKFVNSKKLVAGDSVVFMRRRATGELYAGVRRASRGNDVSEKWNCPVRSVKIDDSSDWRNGKGRVAAEAVLEAVEMAARGVAFEVVCYPRPGWAEFVVKAEAVEESMGVFWTSGMRVKMAMETEDSTRTTWFQGTVSSATTPVNGPWRGSPWRMLQITWDEPEVLQHVKRVNPWQVEYVVPGASLHAAFPPTKKFKAPQNSVLLPHGEGELAFPVTGLCNSMMGQLNPSLLNYTSFPAGMQGARQNQLCESILSDFKSSSFHQMNIDKLIDNGMKPNLETVSTELNIGSSLSESLSIDSQNSVHFSGNKLVGKQGLHSSEKVGLSSFQLFGTIIHTVKPVEGGINDVGFAEGTRNNVYKEFDGADNALDLSLTYSYAKMSDKLDVRYPRASALEACFL